MVSYIKERRAIRIKISVLILIVVEDGLVLMTGQPAQPVVMVLILIVVEDGLVLMAQISVGRNGDVLILIVVEDGLVQCR